MKILLVITKAEVGGAQMSVLNLARGFKEKGNEVTVGLGEGDFLTSELDRKKIKHNKLSGNIQFLVGFENTKSF